MDRLKAYIIADIEGTTGVWSREDTLIGRSGWREARRDMTLDVNAAVEGLMASQAETVMVKDFHRDGYNLIPSLLHKKATLIQGYFMAPHLMYGSLHGAHRAFFIGMHAGSGTSDGFLSHTLTSRIQRLTIGGKAACEAQLFAHVLGEAGVPVAFFSGCPVACQEARESLPWLVTCPVPKNPSERERAGYKEDMRALLKEKIKEAASLTDVPLYAIEPPYDCEIAFCDEAFARRAEKWGVERRGEKVSFSSPGPMPMILTILKCAYFSPGAFLLAPLLLPVVRLIMPMLDHFRQ
jgi:D-amino peptidase